MESYLVPVYAAYLVTTVGLVVWLAVTLYRNGAVFLQDVFPDRPDMASAVNHLLVTGFAMFNLGYGFFLMTASEATTGQEAFEVLARKLGILLVSLAAFHFLNMIVLHRIAASRRQRELVPPIAPQRWVDPSATQLPPPPDATGPAVVF